MIVPKPTAKSSSPRSIRRALSYRMAARVSALSDVALHHYLSDAVYLERLRFGQERPTESRDHEERDQIEQAARAVHQGRSEMEDALTVLVKGYANEIHTRFSDKAYGLATKLAPGALNRLLTSTKTPGAPAAVDFEERLVVHGPTAQIARLAKDHTLILVPNHVSNLDSPLVGLALHQAKLPPFIYGAGLNLFTNPAMAFFMSRLGAYTVDRRKRHRLYKDVLKDYSRERIGRGHHSLFYPGGTRSRSGRIERHLKRGLLGTAIDAWQEGLTAGRPTPEVLVVPCTLSFSLVLEAETLIADALSGEGKSRFIITDDEFNQPNTLQDFARSALALDTSVCVRFGAPMDLLGNPVDEAGRSMTAAGTLFDRRPYVADASGEVIVDSQRDRVYTDQLASAVTATYARDNTVMSTHLAARAAWDCLQAKYPRKDTFELVLLAGFERWVDRPVLIRHMRTLLAEVSTLRDAGRIRTALPADPIDQAEAVLQEAVERFQRFHSQAALDFEDWRVRVDPKLALYYGNRLAGYELSIAPPESAA